jgi:leucyl aminopeptidase
VLEGVAAFAAPEAATRAALGWALGTYAFTRYKERKRGFATLALPAAADRGEVERLARGIFLGRDLVNTPAIDMGPAELAAAAEKVAGEAGARFSVVVGDDLLTHNYPTIHTVGRASTRAPRLIDIVWGDPDAPKVTLVGKGVCFDSGGLDIKPSSGMKTMKKDMGGAATALGLASAIMDAGLPVRLRVLIPAVENAVSGSAMRPLDVVRTRKGITVEIGNTDAEGRLILCDALAEADSEKPAILIDFATLTGAARVALGPDLPALFSSDDALAADLLAAGTEENDPMWRLPLYAPYRKMLDSKVADINNVSDSGYAGAITAALYLQEFVSKDTPWAHLDLFAWNNGARPGRPEGGEVMTIRAVYAYLRRRFG